MDKNLTEIEKFEDIIYKLVMDRELNEKDRERIDKIVEKKSEKIYGDGEDKGIERF